MVLTAAGCGSSSTGKSVPAGSSTADSSTAGSSNPAGSPANSAPPGASFAAASAMGAGRVVVDARGHTVYVLTADGHTNLPCDDASGCTKVWPDLPLANGEAPTAGAGLQPSLLGTMKLADGQTYPTYAGWLMYEFSQDTGAGQAHGQGLHSFGGTWYTLDPAGHPVTALAVPSTMARS